MTAKPKKDLVLVEFEYEYTGRDGGVVSIKPNERYILLAKTNDHWWHVRKDERTKPFYIPAKYVKELPSDFPSPLDFICPSEPAVPELGSSKRPVEMVEERPGEVTIRVRSSNNYKKAENRMSTFGVPLDIQDFKRGGLVDSGVALQPHSCDSAVPSACSKDPKRFSLFSTRSAVEDPEHLALKSRVPSFSPADPVIRPTQAKPVEPPVVKDIEVKEPIEQPKPPPGFEDPPSLDSDQSQESENIYESISDLQDLRLTESPVGETAPPLTPALSPAPAQPLAPSPTSQPEKTSPNTALYVNISDLKKRAPPSGPPVSSPAPRPLSLDSEGWEVHTDPESGQEYYYHPASGQSTWDNPRSPLMDPESPLEVLSSPSPARSPSPCPPVSRAGGCDWERLMDETSGRHYFYNHTSGKTSWVPPGPKPPSSPLVEPGDRQKPRSDSPPPLPDEDYPMDDHEEPRSPLTFPKDFPLPQIKRAVIPRASMEANPPAGWTRSVDPEGKTVFTSDQTPEQWIKSVDEKGQTYYYSKDGSKSLWNLPELSAAPSQPKVGNGVDPEGVGVLKNWRQSMSPSQFSTTNKDDVKFFPTHRRNVSDYGSDASSSPELSHHVDRFKHRRNPSIQSSDSQQLHAQTLEKAGIVNKTKIAENGKRLRKNWAPSWTVLHGGILTFHKDPKSSAAGTANKSNQIIPEYTVELRGSTINWASKDKSSKKNVLELKTRHGSEYLMQYDTESIIGDWLRVISDSIRQLDLEHHSEEEEDDGSDKSPTPVAEDKDRKKTSARLSTSSHSADTEQGRVRTKLRKFLQRRPTLQSVKEKGYIRDSVFGCHLDTLHIRENRTVPSFVEKCIKAVEKRGLNIDGIYRVSGNLAVIQKLRHKADHEENLDLEDGQWEEIHVITGALKLFLRELPEPLFPYSHFESFIAAIKLSDYSQRVSYMHDLVKSLPLPNLDTMKLLFKHLRKVIEFGEVNRMSVQSVAIVFGPTLLRPEMESANITMHMVFQSQIVELILNEYEKIFPPD